MGFRFRSCAIAVVQTKYAAIRQKADVVIVRCLGIGSVLSKCVWNEDAVVDEVTSPDAYAVPRTRSLAHYPIAKSE